MEKPTFKDLCKLTWKLTTYGGTTEFRISEKEKRYAKDTLLRLKVFVDDQLDNLIKVAKVVTLIT